MNESKERNKYYTFIAIAIGVALFAMLICFRVFSVNAAEIIPDGDLQDEEYVLVSWDSSVFYAPEPVFTTTISDSQYPSTSVSLSYARVENSRIYFSYHVENEGTFVPDEVRFSVYNSAGNVLQDVWLDNGLSIYDYKICRGDVVGWTNNLVYFNSSYGFSFADIDTLGYSGIVIYFCSTLNNVDYYYAAQVSAGTFTLVHDSDNSETILAADSSAITLFSWDNSDREWIVISLDATEQTLKAYPVDKIIRLQGTSGIYLTYDAWARFDTRYFRDDVADVPDNPDEPTTDTPCYSFVYNQGGSFYLIDVFGVPSYDSECNVDSTFTSLAAATNSYNKTFIHPTYFNIKNGYYGGSWLGGYYGPVITFYTTLKSFSHAYVYSMGTSYLSNADFVRENFTPSQIANAADYRVSVNGSFVYYNQGYQLKSLSDGTYLLGLWGISNQYSFVSLRESYFSGYVQYEYSVSDRLNYINPFESGSSTDSNKPYYQALGHMLGAFENVTPVEPTPSPEPTFPPDVTPTPVPTEPPHVIVTWPTGTPTPTPVATMPITIPTSPIGDLDLDTTVSVFDTGTDVISHNAQPGLLAFAFSFLPPEIQYLVWFLIFVLVLLAIIRMVIHFGGG